jgi:gas vesicle protein
MKSRKNPKKYIVGGIIGGVAGLGQAIYGGIQANKAKKEMERIQKTAPDLNAPISTPSEYFKAYKEAYDQDIMNRQMESIKSGLAGTTEALAGAGGRALLGGIGAATQQAQRQTQGIADIQQQRQAEALQGLAAAQERTRGLQENRLGMKEARFQNQVQMAQGARDAAVQTIAGGIGNIGSAAIYGFDDADFGGYNNPDPTRQGFSKKARDLRKADRLAAMEEGGKVMKTPGEFSHKTNPIDIMRNGKKIAEATGGEYIFNPKQMSNIKKYVATDDKSKLHNYVKALIKRFEK